MARQPVTRQSSDDGVEPVDLLKQVAENLDLSDEDMQGGEEDFDVKDGDVDAEDTDEERAPTGLEDSDEDQEEELETRPQERQQEQQQQEEQPAGRPDRYEMDKKGNVVDPATGKILARSGAEARLFQDKVKAQVGLFRARAEGQALRKGLERAVEIARGYRTQLDAFKKTQESISRLNLSPTEQAEALEIASMFRTQQGAVEGIKKILTRVSAAGYDLSSLGLGAGNSGIDVKEVLNLVRSEIGNATKPLVERTNEERRRAEQDRAMEEAHQRALVSTATFFEQNPEAVPFAPVIERAVRDETFQGWSLREIWQAIQIHRMRHPSSDRRNGNGNGTMPRGIPGGRQRPPEDGFDVNKSAPATARFEDIINDLLDRANVR